MGNYQASVLQNALGYDVVINQDMDSIVIAKKLLFGDMSYFYVREVVQPTIYSAWDRFTPDLGIRGFIRLDCV